MSAERRVSVVVPTFRRPDLLARCLAALLRQDLPGEAYEVIIADDGAEDRIRDLVADMARTAACAVTWIPVSGRHGPSAARNAGWRAARAPVIAFTDDDTVPHPGWLKSGLTPFSDAGVVAVTGRLEMPLPPVPTDYEKNAAGLATAAFVTANCFCRRSALEAIGGFDETFTRAWREDSDLHFRLLALGRLVKARDAVVVHPVRSARWGVSLRQQRNNFFEALLYRKHPAHYRGLPDARPPWRYYATVACAATALCCAVAGRPPAAVAFAAAWALETARFLMLRLRGTSRAPAHVWEMAVTSALIPPVALYWRLRGAWRYRVPFL